MSSMFKFAAAALAVAAPLANAQTYTKCNPLTSKKKHGPSPNSFLVFTMKNSR
jgi:hypothetical protein